MTARYYNYAAPSQLVLSLFPGIDLLGKGFEAEGFCVVRAPDLLWGGDIRDFHAPRGRFDGIIAGSPCQDFSSARRAAPTGHGLAMLTEFARVVNEAAPRWFLLENVARVPDVTIEGYTVQRFDLNARECGLRQSRLRHFQFGSRAGLILIPERQKPVGTPDTTCLASEGQRQTRRSFADFCELQGLSRTFDLSHFSISLKYRVVGNGVPVPMARVVARAIRDVSRTSQPRTVTKARLCVCQCGRIVTGRQRAATAGCRKRMQRRRGEVLNTKALNL